jgi:hypothetical protein
MAKALLFSTFQSLTAYKMNLHCDLAFQTWAVPFHSACNIRTKHKQKLRTRIAHTLWPPMSSLTEMCQVLGTLAPIYTSSCFPNMEPKEKFTSKAPPQVKTVCQKGVLSVKNYWEAKLF